MYDDNKLPSGLETLDNTTIDNADIAIVGDTSNLGRAKGITWANVKAALKTYFDTLYPAGSGTSTGSNTGDEVVALATGFTITKGTVPKTLTVPLDASVSGTNTGDNATNSQYSGLAASKEDVVNKSTNVTTDGASDTKYPSVKSVKDYADSLILGLIDYRGGYDASVNTFPASGGSGTAGAVLKGDMWILSVAGTLGGVAVQIGDSVIANVDTPGQTAGNWNILNSNIAYVPEDVANKAVTMSGNTTSDTKYLSAKAVYDWGVATFAALAGSITQAFQVSQLEVGHATDTSITRVSAGVIAVEGNNVLTANTGLPLAGGTMTGKTVQAGVTEVAKTYTPATGAQTVTLDCSVNNQHVVTGHASGTAITFAITGDTNSQLFLVSILQGAVVSTITAWMATVRWAGGTAPTLTATVGKRDTFGFIRTGANTYDGVVISQNA